MKRTSYYVAIAVLICLFLPGLLMAGGQKDEAVASEEPVTITWWGHTYKGYIPMYEKIIEEFQEANPNITVDYYQKKGAQYAELFLQAYAADSSPDTFRVGDWIITEFIRDEVTAPIDVRAFDAGSVSEIENRYLPGALKPFVSKGNLYAIPEDLTTLLLLVNKDHLKEAGLSALPDNAAGWVDAMKKMTKMEGDRWVRSGFEWKYNHELWDLIQFTGVLRDHGTKLYEPDGTMVLDKAKTTAALKYLYDSIHTHKFANPDFASSAGGDFQDGFMSTTTAGAYKAPAIKAKGIVTDWTTTEWMTGSNHNTMRWSWCLGLSSQSEHKMEASKFLAFMTKPETLPTRMAMGGQNTGLKGWEQSDYIQQNPIVKPWFEIVEKATYVDQNQDYAKVSIALSNVLQEIAMAGLTADEAYKKLYDTLPKFK